VRRFLVRLTLVSSSVAAAIVSVLSFANRAPWPLVLTRASIAFLIVLAVGFLASLILMRTALRRYYEQNRHGAGLDGARAER
jgi:prepilin signal peptidase PulO-like enzyme (type II secretory pathway)